MQGTPVPRRRVAVMKHQQWWPGQFEYGLLVRHRGEVVIVRGRESGGGG